MQHLTIPALIRHVSAFAATPKDTRPTLKAIRFNLKEHYIAAADGYRVIVAESDTLQPLTGLPDVFSLDAASVFFIASKCAGAQEQKMTIEHAPNDSTRVRITVVSKFGPLSITLPHLDVSFPDVLTIINKAASDDPFPGDVWLGAELIGTSLVALEKMGIIAIKTHVTGTNSMVLLTTSGQRSLDPDLWKDWTFHVGVMPMLITE